MKKLVPVVLLVLVLTPFPLFGNADPACVSDCQTNYNTCVAACGSAGTFWCYDDCDTLYNTCYYQCTLCPSTRDYTVNTVLSQQFTGATECLQDFSAINRGLTFWEYFVQYNETKYRETTACNGAKTTTVLSTANRQTHCLRETAFTCSPFLSPTLFNICAF